jgi:hypothetical protein
VLSHLNFSYQQRLFLSPNWEQPAFIWKNQSSILQSLVIFFFTSYERK